MAILLIFPLGIAIFAFVAKFILNPISRVVRSVKAPTRFQITDLVSLMLLLQFVLAAGVGFIKLGPKENIELPEMMPALIAATVAISLLWAGGVSYVSQARIDNPLRRIVFVTLVLPGTVGLMMVAAGATVGLIIGYSSHEPSYLRLTCAFAVFLGVPIGCVLLRGLVLWIVRGAKTVAPLQFP